MRRQTCIYLLIFLCLGVCANAQTMGQGVDQTDSLVRTLAYIKHAMRFSRYYPQEKVYLHLDNTGYFKGETIWFKAYVVRCDTEQRTDLSHVLYVELLNPSGDVVEKRKLPIENGEAHGDIKVDSIQTTGFYEVRAYTRYMTNWGTNACFSRVIPIFKAPKTEGDYSAPVLDQLSYKHRLNNERLKQTDNANTNVVDIIQDHSEEDLEDKSSLSVRFYPEGGDLVVGLPSRVAFTIMDKDGMPLAADGYVRDDTGRKMATIKSNADGCGLFILDTTNRPLTAVVKDIKGKEHSFELPLVKPSGCTMAVDVMDTASLKVDIRATDDMLGRKLGYVMTHGGSLVRCDTLTAESYKQVTFKRGRLPEGVNVITLFNSEGRVMAERMFFICPKETVDSVSVTHTQDALKPCGKVTFNLQSEPNTSLSFSAIDAQGLVNGREGDIRTWMLLSSEVGGYIAHPEYYFESDDAEHRRAADLLMMVQGWRRYDWRLMSGQAVFDRFQPIEDQLYLFGRLRAKSRRTPVNGVSLKATLYNHEGQSMSAETLTDSAGYYNFVLPDANGEWRLLLNTKYGDKSVNYTVGIDRHFSPQGRYVSPLETRMVEVDPQKTHKWTDITDEDDGEWVSITKKTHVLKNVTVKGKGRVWDRTSWGNETDARKFSLIYYDCDEAVDRIADEGGMMPTVEEWLTSKNSFFHGKQPTEVALMRKKNNETEGAESADGGSDGNIDLTTNDYIAMLETWFEPTSEVYDQYYNMPPHPWKKLYSDGLSYKNRPIVWIIDNMFVTITDFNVRGQYMPVNWIYCDNNSNTMDLPGSLDELKCVYISEDPRSMLAHLHCSEVEQQSPVVLYCYTHRSFLNLANGLRVTHFEGFNVPSKFQMEDYSKIPPMEDFRRTLYWQPDVRTDSEGKAKVEFYNNSSCREMFISVEGMTPDGKFLTNE
ncbi:MAG: hypothetical protein IKH26_14525 [Bacteroidaceae bacterium]|nr:hypothetical protein [Bacteroidaceae bacterium]